MEQMDPNEFFTHILPVESLPELCHPPPIFFSPLPNPDMEQGCVA